MKHKKYDFCYPYTYYIKCKITGKKYHGVRYANIKMNLTPIEDFAKIYFTSGKLRDDFKNNVQNYQYRLCWTFDTIDEARDYESKVNTKLMRKDDWEVWNNSKTIFNKINPRQGVVVKGTETATKIGDSNRNKKRTNEQKYNQSLIQKKLLQNGHHYWCSEAHKENNSKRMKQNNPSKNGLNKEHKNKIGNSQRGISKGPQTEQHRINNSLAHIGQIPWNKGKKIGPLSEEHKKKTADARRGKKRGKYILHKEPHGTAHLQGKKSSCLCCHREFDLGNLAKHLRKKENESPV